MRQGGRDRGIGQFDIQDEDGRLEETGYRRAEELLFGCRGGVRGI